MALGLVSLAHAGALHGWLVGSARSTAHPAPHRPEPVVVTVVQRGEPTAGTAPPAPVPIAQASHEDHRSHRRAAPPPEPTEPGDMGATASAQPIDYLPAETLDAPPLPLSAPDYSLTDGHLASGLPLHVLLCIDAQGHVQDVTARDVTPADQALFETLAAMYKNTRFLPGRLNGVAVATRLALELQPQPGLIQEAPEPSPTPGAAGAPSEDR